MSLLITPTLLDAYDFYKTCPPSWKNKAEIGLYNTLNRIFEETEESKMGKLFEDKVYKNAGKAPVGSELFQKVCNGVKDSVFGYKGKKFIEINGVEYCLYARPDAYNSKMIHDIKTTGNYKGKDSYLKKWQHIFYTYIFKIKDFRYIVVEWNGGEGEDKYKIAGVNYIDYHIDDPGTNQEKIKTGIEEFIKFLETDPDLKDAYLNKFNLYNK
jgi:hypothetical protein